MARPNRNNNGNCRAAYERISSDGNEELEAVLEGGESSSTSSLRRVNRIEQYSRISIGQEGGDDEEAQQLQQGYNDISETEEQIEFNSAKGSTNDEDEETDGVRINVVILDYTQKKFNVAVSSSTTVAVLKQNGAIVHKVPASRQRLIFRGQLLADTTLLANAGIKEDGVIVHLFPKPRVVIQDSNAASGGNALNSDANAENASQTEDADAAHVPTIFLETTEAERRSQILVLGSVEFIETQNNVKLFSFMLLIISCIELLNLLAIALGVPQDQDEASYPVGEEDDILGPLPPSLETNDAWSQPSSNSSDTGSDTNTAGVTYADWSGANWVDLAVSVLGVYVAMLGLRASNENTLRLAKRYLYGTVLAGVGWMALNYFMTYDKDKQYAAERASHHTDTDFVPIESTRELLEAALSVMVLPGMVWMLCVYRAWQFHRLLQEAEQEAEERIRNELDSSSSGEESEDGRNATLSMTDNPGHDEELALQHESATLT
jgi:hypothetical protein